LASVETTKVPESEPSDSWGNWTLVALLGFATLGVMVLSYLQPISADDYGNALQISRTSGYFDYVRSYYLAWTGRVTGVSIIRFGLAHRPAFAAANGLGFAALAYLTVMLGLGRWPKGSRRDLLVVALVFAAYWFGLPAISETVFWVTGSATYLWSALLMLVFAVPYRLWLGVGTSPSAPVRAITGLWLVALGIVCGMTHELVVAALALLIASFVAHAWRTGRLRQIPFELWLGMPALAAGTALMLMSPGNVARAQTRAAGSPLGDALAFGLYMGKTLGSYLPRLYPWLLLLIIASVPVCALASQSYRRPALRPWIVWITAGLATLAPFILQPQIALAAGARTNLFAAVLFTVGAVSLLSSSHPPRLLDALPQRQSVMFVGLLLCVVLVELGGSMQVARSIGAQVRERDGRIAESIAGGRRDVAVVPLAQKPYRTVYYVDIETDPGYWLNRRVADFYGLNSIRLAP
jgi:hypothetical protein